MKKVSSRTFVIFCMFIFITIVCSAEFDGWGKLGIGLHESQPLVAQNEGNTERSPETGTDTGMGAPGRNEAADTGFGSVDISSLSDTDKRYLGLGDDARPILKNVDADFIMLEFISVYCTSCQMQAPILNQLHSEIEKDPGLRSRVKMFSIGAGNSQKEVNAFRKNKKVPFPILPDPRFAIYEKLANSMRTPYTLMLRKDNSGNFMLVGSHMGLVKSYESYLAEIREALEYKEDALKAKQAEELADKAAQRTELKLSEEELMAKVKESMVKASGDGNISIRAEIIPLQEEPKVFRGDTKSEGRHVKYFAVVVNRESVCDICHAIQFIYVFDEKGDVVGIEPIQLTKYGNKEWNEEDVEKTRKRVLGKSILQPMNFDPEVDAVTSATITSAIIFRALEQGKEIFRHVE